MLEPSFFVVGAAKAGTTSLCNYLETNTNVFMSPIKEPHHFSTDIRYENFTQKEALKSRIDMGKYLASEVLPVRHIGFVESRENYLSLFRDTGAAIISGEGSTGYLYSEAAAKEIIKYNPEAKIIMVLREPVARAYSHWKMNLSSGRADPRVPFSKAVSEDFSSVLKGYCVSNLYVESGLYYEQVKRFFDCFPKDNVMIIKYDDFLADPKSVVAGLFEFIGVDAEFVDTSIKSNVSVISRFPKLKKIAKNMGVGSLLGESIKNRILSGTASRKVFRLCPKERSALYEKYFSRDVELLGQLTGLDFTMWGSD